MHTTARAALRTHVFAAVTVGIAALVGVGCSAEQRRSLGEVDIRDTLAARVEQAVDAEGLQLDGDLECTADIADGTSKVTSSCAGATSSGAVISGAMTGSADVDAGECTAQLVVEIDNDPVADETDVDCFELDG